MWVLLSTGTYDVMAGRVGSSQVPDRGFLLPLTLGSCITWISY